MICRQWPQMVVRSEAAIRSQARIGWQSDPNGDYEPSMILSPRRRGGQVVRHLPFSATMIPPRPWMSSSRRARAGIEHPLSEGAA